MQEHARAAERALTFGRALSDSFQTAGGGELLEGFDRWLMSIASNNSDSGT